MPTFKHPSTLSTLPGTLDAFHDLQQAPVHINSFALFFLIKIHHLFTLNCLSTCTMKCHGKLKFAVWIELRCLVEGHVISTQDIRYTIYPLLPWYPSCQNLSMMMELVLTIAVISSFLILSYLFLPPSLLKHFISQVVTFLLRSLFRVQA